MCKIGLQQMAVIPQLFFKIRSLRLVLLAGKRVDDLFIFCDDALISGFLSKFNADFKLGTIEHEPSAIRFYDLNIFQNVNMSLIVDGDIKLNILEPMVTSRGRHKQTDFPLNLIESNHFRSLHSSL